MKYRVEAIRPIVNPAIVAEFDKDDDFQAKEEFKVVAVDPLHLDAYLQLVRIKEDGEREVVSGLGPGPRLNLIE